MTDLCSNIYSLLFSSPRLFVPSRCSSTIYETQALRFYCCACSYLATSKLTTHYSLLATHSRLPVFSFFRALVQSCHRAVVLSLHRSFIICPGTDLCSSPPVSLNRLPLPPGWPLLRHHRQQIPYRQMSDGRTFL